MLKILKYSIIDLLRGRWSYLYFGFHLALGSALLFLNHDLAKAVLTLMNVILILSPMIGMIFGVLYYYNSEEFTSLLLAQPIRRSQILLGQYLGLSLSLTLSLVLGLGLPFLLYGLLESSAIFDFLLLLVVGGYLHFIFVALAFNIALSQDNKIKGLAYAILTWLSMAVIYDGVFLISLMVFEEYPLDKFSLVATLLNPIDLSRILILLKLDISALLGYTGAVFQKFFGSGTGFLVSLGVLTAWIVLPLWRISARLKKKDF
jgi:Cu-processing system permease protein